MAIEKILVPVDGSEHSDRAVAFAGDLALHHGADVVVLHVVHGGAPRLPDDVATYARVEHLNLTPRDLRLTAGRGILDRAEKRLRDDGVPGVATHAEVGHPAQVIIEFARDELGPEDVIVMGRRGLSNLPALFLGSVSQKVAHNVDRTVVTVK